MDKDAQSACQESPPRTTRPKRPRRISRFRLAAALSGIERQHAALPANSPRIRPTLASLRFLQPDPEGDAVNPVKVVGRP
jgi:hypothetical protein